MTKWKCYLNENHRSTISLKSIGCWLVKSKIKWERDFFFLERKGGQINTSKKRAESKGKEEDWFFKVSCRRKIIKGKK